jgi:hypothetical protein
MTGPMLLPVQAPPWLACGSRNAATGTPVSWA